MMADEHGNPIVADIANSVTKKDVFCYSKREFVKGVDVAPGKRTRFGDLLHSTFDRICEMDGVLRFVCPTMPMRILLSERHHYVAWLNPERGRRSLTHFESVFEQPKGDGRNFAKARSEEIMFSMWCTDDDLACFSDESNNSCIGAKMSPINERRVVMANTSPFGHPCCLVIPDRLNVLPQTLTPGAFRLALHCMLLLGDADMRSAFNSLGGFASVNHRHLHIWRVPQRLFIESVKCYLSGSSGNPVLYETRPPESGIVPGFAVDLASLHDNADRMSHFVGLLCGVLVKMDIAHDMAMTWGRRLADDPSTTIRCFIWPRRKHSRDELQKPVWAAAGELAGSLVVKDETIFNSMTAEWWEKEVREQTQLPSDVFDTIRKAYLKIANTFS